MRQQTVHATVPEASHIVTVPAADNQFLTDEYIISPDTAMFDTRMDLSNITEHPFLNDLLHPGSTSATVPDLDFSWNAGPPSAGLMSPLISPTAHFDAYGAADAAFSLKRRASVASESNIEDVLGQPQVSSLVRADLYVSLPQPPFSQNTRGVPWVSFLFVIVMAVPSRTRFRGSVANANDSHI